MVRIFVLLFCLCFTPALIQAQSHVVLPFFNLSGSPGQNWICESLAESVSDALAEQELLVTERTDRDFILQRLAIKRYVLLTRATVLKTAMSLDASAAVYGKVEPSEAGIRITVYVLNTRKLASLGEFTDSGPVADLSRMQTRLSWQVLRALMQPFAISEEEYIRTHPAIQQDALKSYIAGLQAGTDPLKLRHFAQAARIDPNYSAPAFELGRLYFQRKQWQEAALWLSRLDGSANHFREATFYLGIARYYLNDFEAAEQAFAHVVQAVPLNEVFNNLAATQSRLGQEASLENFEKALTGAEADPTYQFNVGYALMKRRDFSGAAERFQAVLERVSNDPQASEFLKLCQRNHPPSQIPEGAERLKLTYPENIFLQIKAILQPSKSR